MEVGPHPHIGLSTVTWLLDGEGLHSESLGTQQVIRPGQLNLMTAGHGIAHAEPAACDSRSGVSRCGSRNPHTAGMGRRPSNTAPSHRASRWKACEGW